MYNQVFSAAREVDLAFLYILSFAVFILIAVTVAMLWFLWRYHHQRNPEASKNKGSILAEIIWTGLPLLIVLGMFWTGWTSFKAMRTIPDGALTVESEGRMWSFKFTYPNGKTDSELTVPVNTPVKVILKSRDVIHGFYVPAMRIKWDMVPGMDTDVWFQSEETGEFDIFCSEYCGLRHANMITKLHVVTQEEYDAYLNAEDEPILDGIALMDEYGCYDCHSDDGTEDVAPTFLNIAERDIYLIMPDGAKRTIQADDEYLRRAIIEPGAELVEGWDDEMPSYEDDITEEHLKIIVDTLLGKAEAPPHPGLAQMDEQGCTSCHLLTSEPDIGPGLGGLFGKTHAVTRNDKPEQVMVDEAYLRESLVDPSILLTDGYDDGMPGYDDLDEETINLLVDFMKHLNADGTTNAKEMSQ